MEGFENNENQEYDINVVDFPFICRICLKRSDSRLFKVEDYLLNLYLTITKINASPTASLPENICNDCMKTLEDISLLIDISMNNNAKLGKNFTPININEHLETAVCGMPQKHVIDREEYEEDLQYFKGFEICRICYSTNVLKPVEEKAHLMQLFHNITNINAKTGVLSCRNCICNKCMKKLEIISLFINVSLCNEMKLKNTIGRNEAIDMGYHNKVKIDGNFDENVYSYDSKSLHTIIDIKEEIVDTSEASTEKINQNGIKKFSASHQKENSLDCGPCKNKFGTGTNLKELFISVSLCDEIKLKHTIGRNGALDTENCLEGNAIDMGYCNKVKKYEEFDKNAHTYDSKNLHTIIDIKEEIVDTSEASTERLNQNGMKSLSESHCEENSLDCDPCKNKFGTGTNLKELFISVSFCDEIKLKHTIGRNGAVDTENCLEGNAIDMGYCNKVKKYEEFDKNAHSYDSKSLHTIIDIKGEMFDTPEASTEKKNQNRIQKSSESHSEENSLDAPCKDETNQKNLLKGLNIKLEIQSGTNRFRCHSCDKSFSQKQTLKSHLLTHTGKKSLKCNYCRKKFYCKRNLRKHFLSHTKSRPFKCDCCEISFPQMGYLRRHMRIHTGEKPFKCISCEKRFSEKSNLQRHILLIHAGENLFKCDSCEKSFNRKSNLLRHMVIHTGGKPFKCDRCEKSFSRQWSLQQHMPIHTGENLFQCGYCKRTFALKQSLKRHMLTHTGEKPFKCDCCKKSYNRKSNLKQHMLIHTGQKSFRCGCCEKTFAIKQSLKRHMLTHTGEKPFKCDICEKSFFQKGHLQMHMLIHTGEKPFKCDRCEKSFFRQWSLHQHMLIHTGENSFKCDCCEKRFSQKTQLQRHMLIHTGEKSFKCDRCEKSFFRQWSLQQHMLSHTGEKPFQCGCCEKTFALKHSLKRHMLIHN